MFNNLSPDESFDHIGQVEGEMETYNLDYISRLNVPITLTPEIATFHDIAIHMIFRQRLTRNRTEKLLNYAGNKMKTHNVNYLNPNYQDFIRYMDYREQVEDATPHMLKYEWQIWQKILTAFGIPHGTGQLWNYKPPSPPPTKPRYIPLPDEMHHITHHDYSTNKTKNAFIQYSLEHSAMLGWRNPSELCLLKTNDIQLDTGIITITEKKKHMKKRLLIPDYPQIINSRQIKSIKNWIDIWRPRITTQHSDDFLYIRPTDGRPLREMQYTRYINYYVHPLFPKFQLYSTRHFCATGLLIKEYITNGHWNKNKIQNRLGHENESTTNVYIKYAEQYLKLAPYDWFKRVLRQQNKWLEDNSLKSTNGQKTPLSSGNPPERSEVSERKQILYK